MKFVCDNCRAKYQIADEKVAGKTVRMKCRRCGHVITVSSAVTETSVARRPPAPAPSSGAGKPASPGASPLSTTGASPAVRIANEDTDESTQIMTGEQHLALRAAVAKRAAERKKPPVPRGSTPGASGPGRPAPPPRPSGASRTSTPEPEGRAYSAPALAGAFNKAVSSSAPASTAGPETPADDWYVGVGGVPLGPVRLSVIKEKASQGAVDAESLVWREGFDEWQPLKKFPRLLELVEEARSRRTGNPPAAHRTPTPAPSSPGIDLPAAAAAAPDDKAGRPTSSSSGSGPLAALALSAASGGATSSGASSRDSSSASAPAPSASSSGPIDVLGDPFAAPEAARSSNGAARTNGAVNGAAALSAGSEALDLAKSEPLPSQPDARPSEASLSGPASIDPALAAGLGEAPARRRGLHPMAYAFIAMAAVFGGVAAWSVFGGKEKIVFVEKQVTGENPTPGGAAPPPPPPEEEGDGANPEQPTDTATQAANGSTSTGGPLKAGGTPSSGGETDTGSKSGPNIDTSGFDTGVSGPSATGPDGSGPDKGGGQLSSGEVQGVVAKYTPAVRRACWQPALSAASPKASKSAKVNAKIVVGSSGAVQSVSASGSGKDYPSLAPCIAGHVRGWKFPSSGGSTTVNVPFSFIAQ